MAGKLLYTVRKRSVFLQVNLEIEKLLLPATFLVASETLGNRRQLALEKIRHRRCQVSKNINRLTSCVLLILFKFIVNLVDKPDEKFVRVVVLVVVKQNVAFFNFLHEWLRVKDLALLFLF